MSDEKVYTPEVIADNPLPNQIEGEDFDTFQSTSKQNYNQEKIKDQGFPEKRIAYEVIGTSLNTKSKKILAEYEFSRSGAIQIGKYTEGESGDLRLTPDGITARDLNGETTFAIDGDTGDAIFKGTVRAGSIVTGEVVVGNNTWIIDGDPDKPRIILYNDGTPEIVIGEVG